MRHGAARSDPPARPAHHLAPTAGTPWDGRYDHDAPWWDDHVDRPGPAELRVGALGPGTHEIMCCAMLRTDTGCPVCDRACWLCEARAGRACRSLASTRRIAGVAHVARLWNLGLEEQDDYLAAMTRPCPHCQAQNGQLCHTVPRASTRPHLARRPHQRRR
ncbi:hypothetical protein ACIOGZ_29150 [Kitasatospora sp. NPDC088160]|uniref:hypothetical protein n=1 Tax=Kitasatospora sp. NPDC088160 TaxID=3364072 RepID=UPI00382736DD